LGERSRSAKIGGSTAGLRASNNRVLRRQRQVPHKKNKAHPDVGDRRFGTYIAKTGHRALERRTRGPCAAGNPLWATLHKYAT